jgi:hypothetical protein
MPIETLPRFTREVLRSRPADLFVFGDNMMRSGLGGQAKACRGEPNAVGIPTKWAPSFVETAFFTDADLITVKAEIDSELLKLANHINAGGTIVFPEAGIGTGLAQLPERAPRIYGYLTRAIERLHEIDSLLNT